MSMTEREIVLKKIEDKPVWIANRFGFDKLSEIHDEWLINMIWGHDDFTLQAHRGSYKTTCVSVALALLLILEPHKRIMFMRKTDGDVKEVVKQVQKILKDKPARDISKAIHGSEVVLTTESQTEINTNLKTGASGTSQLLGIGLGGSITGKHFDYIFTDDIVNANDRTSRAERERTKLIYQELQNVRNQGGRIFNTGTPWHKEDAFSIMPEPKKWDYRATGILSDKEIEERRQSMLPSLFAANYELRHIASESVIFLNPKIGASPSMVEQGIMQLDSAFYGDDYTAWSIMSKHDDKYYLYGKMKRKHVEDCYTEIMSDYRRFNCGKLYNENNADKGMVGKELRKLGIKVILYHEDMNKYLKIVTYLKAIWKDLIFVDGTDTEYIEQVCDYYEDAAHDDAPDSAASLARILINKRKSDYTPLWN